MRGLFRKRGAARQSEPETAPQAGEPARIHTARIGDRFGLALRGALQDQPYEVLQNVQLQDFLSLTYPSQGPGGTLGREARKKMDFLIVTRPGQVPVLGISLTTSTYGRDRRRAPEASTGTEPGKSIVTVLHLDPHVLTTPEAIFGALKPHLP